jgi:hypothetical protein
MNSQRMVTSRRVRRQDRPVASREHLRLEIGRLDYRQVLDRQVAYQLESSGSGLGEVGDFKSELSDRDGVIARSGVK